MADLFTPVTHVDGELYNAVQVNRLEVGLDAVDTELDVQTDRIDTITASGGSSRQFLSGPTANRPAPTVGMPYWDTDLTRLIVGTGSAWVNPDGSAAPVGGGGGGGGSSTAPANMTAVVIAGGTIGAIVLTWDAVAGATSYKLYETQSPSGVSGATGLTTTTSTRTPSTARNYDYWVTALVAGVESATSNHVTATLPYVAGGGPPPPGGSSDPSTFLNINGLGNGTGGWWNLGIGFSSGHTDITPVQLQGGYINSPYYCMNPALSAVQMEVFMNGGTTSANSNYPRCEFREMAAGSTTTKASWSGSSGHHIMRGKTKVMHFESVKPETVVAQMHDASDDTLQIHVTGSSATGPQTWRLKLLGSTAATIASGVALGQEVAWDIDVNNGLLVVKIDGVQQYSGTPGFGAGQYFKAGEYIQQNSTTVSNPATGYGRAELRDLFVSHA